MRDKVLRILYWVGLFVLVALGLWLWPRGPKPLAKLDESAYREDLARSVAQLLNSTGAMRGLSPVPSAPVYVVLRKRGVRVADGWFEGEDAQMAALAGVERLAADNGAEGVDVVELCLPYGERSLKPRAEREILGNTHRGVKGLRLRFGDREMRVCPTAMIARNARFQDIEADFRKEHMLSPAQYESDVEAWSFEAHQLLVRLGDKPAVIPMFRGNNVVPMEAVNRAGVQALADGLGRWMRTQVQPDGRMVYMWFPSRGTEARDNNMIRQFMASVCLVRMGNERPEDTALRELARRNIRYNLEHFYVEEEGGLGLIRWGDARLGAMALAALSIVEAPFRKEFERYETGLRKTTEYMQKADGSFFSFFGSDSDRNQNFYPGETLLLWATLYEESRDPALWERIDNAFKYYRKWHLENRNPAFIPWHTQAYVKLLKLRPYPEMRDFVFEMNDWLLDVQQWDGVDYPDQRGRFHDPNRPFGPPHASSTAVYLEGLIDAYQLAVMEKDEARRKRYRTAILRGLRSLMQLQFTDGVDMFYISQRERVYGGLRTTVYDNRIRVDNVQHALMGIQRILKTFNAEGDW